jgi:hypothetical protein
MFAVPCAYSKPQNDLWWSDCEVHELVRQFDFIVEDSAVDRLDAMEVKQIVTWQPRWTPVDFELHALIGQFADGYMV